MAKRILWDLHRAYLSLVNIISQTSYFLLLLKLPFYFTLSVLFFFILFVFYLNIFLRCLVILRYNELTQNKNGRYSRFPSFNFRFTRRPTDLVVHYISLLTPRALVSFLFIYLFILRLSNIGA